MKRMKWVAVAVMVLLCGMARADEAKPVEVVSKIKDVTVYADRARVTRVGSCQTVKGEHLFVFRELPGWVDEESVRLALEPAAAGRIVDVRVEREYLATADDDALRKAQAAVQDISDQINALDDEKRLLDAEARQIENIKVFSTDKLPKDAALADVKIEEYAKVVNFVGERLRSIVTQRRALEIKRREIRPEQEVLQKQLNDLRSRASLQQTLVLVTLESPAPAAATLALTYMLPGATWTPVHEVRAEAREPTSLQLLSYAMLTQTTGEDWQGANVSFATQSATKTMSIPQLEAMLLGNVRTAAMVAGGSSSSFSRAQRMFEGQQAAWNNYQNPDELVRDLNSNRAKQKRQEAQASQIFQKLLARGTSAHFAGGGKPIVRSDGKPVRVPIGQTQLEAKTVISAVPEVSLNAARIVHLTNTGSQPLLPGKVALYQGGAFLGMTATEFVAEGESFSIFLNNADEIKLSRVLDRRKSTMKRGRRTQVQAAFVITVENLSDRPLTLGLSDRIPVSQNKEIEVYKVRIDPGTEPDSKGLVNWDVTLNGGEKKIYKVGYTIEYPPEILAQMRKARQSKNAPAQALDLSVQMENLEMMF
jgi:uncharacterized protein (TIGR02231 family)